MNTHWQGGITEAANMTSESDMNSSATYHADTQTLQVLPPISAAQKKEPKKNYTFILLNGHLFSEQRHKNVCAYMGYQVNFVISEQNADPN